MGKGPGHGGSRDLQVPECSPTKTRLQPRAFLPPKRHSLPTPIPRAIIGDYYGVSGQSDHRARKHVV